MNKLKNMILIPAGVLLSIVLLATGDSVDTAAADNITYSIKSTMTSNTAETTENSTSDYEPYFSKQWALFNDGTFSIETRTPDGKKFEDGGYYRPGDFFMNNPFFNRGNQNSNYGGGKYNKYSATDVYSLNYFIDNSRTQYTQLAAAVAGIDLDAEKAWETVGDTGKDILVAVIDTGVDYTHEDLKNIIWTNEEEIPGDGIDNDGNGYVDDVYGWDFYNNKPFEYDSSNPSEYDHGTHCAGTIAAEINNTGIAGIASNGNVKIMIVKALGGKDGSGDTVSIAKAIQYAESMGADICNLSFGTTSYDEKLEDALKNSDMMFVCASGNGNSRGIGTTPLYPAAFDLDNIISVANLKADGILDTSSNYGVESVDIAAPGTYILSTTAGNEYAYLSGSSMSAPMVTGVLALTYSYYEDITAPEARDIVLAAAEPLDSLENKVATGGMVNAYNAVTADVESILD